MSVIVIDLFQEPSAIAFDFCTFIVAPVAFSYVLSVSWMMGVVLAQP